MTRSTLLDVSISFPSAADPAGLLTVHEHLGFELGWDYARHGIAPPAPYAQQPSPLHDGLAAGSAAFGGRTSVPVSPSSAGCNCACTPGCAD